MSQGVSTAGGCRYRQEVPPGQDGRLDVNTNYGIRKALLPQVPNNGLMFFLFWFHFSM